MLTGKWTYRSFRNSPALIGDDPSAALALIFGEGVFDLEQREGELTGALGMGTGYALTITGDVEGGSDHQTSFSLVGIGVPDTATAGWRYDYRGTLGYQWPKGADQPDCLLGTVIRVNAHGPNAPAGVTASFIAVRQDESAQPRSGRNFSLMAD